MMERTLIVSEALYTRLKAAAGWRGFSIERLLEEWLTREDELCQRQDVVRQIDTLREHLSEKHGEMTDSADLIREDRAR